MNSRKKLKKEVKNAFDVLYCDIVFYEAFAVDVNEEAARAIAKKAMAAEKEFVKRINVNEGKYVKGRVKMYFNKLREDFATKTAELSNEIAAL